MELFPNYLCDVIIMTSCLGFCILCISMWNKCLKLNSSGSLRIWSLSGPSLGPFLELELTGHIPQQGKG